MASRSKHFTAHVIATIAAMTLSLAGAVYCFCNAKENNVLVWVGAFLLVLWGVMIVRLWQLICLPLRQASAFVGAMESRDTTMRFPDSKDPLLGDVLDDMNRVLRSYCNDRFAMESQRQYYDRILRVMTHEMRNAITPIITLTDWMQTNAIAEADLKVSLDIIHGQATGIRSFLDNYQRLTHLPDPQLCTISARSLFDKLRVALSKDIPSDRISYNVSGEPVLHADEKLLTLALLNIVRNAVRAIDGKPDGHISLVASSSPKGVRLVVSNNGPLIPPTQTEVIFEPFYSTRKEGSGIGLALSRRIMELHGGSLTCDSNPPLTLFTFAFPL